MAGNEALFRDILGRFGAPLRRVSAAYESDRGLREDLYQEICVAIWRALGQFRGEASLRTFVFRIAHNRGVTHLARRGRRRAQEPVRLEAAAEGAEPEDTGPTPERVALMREQGERLRRAVEALPLGLRQTVTLRLEGLRDREISEVLGITPGNVAVRLSRARKQLREMLGEPS